MAFLEVRDIHKDYEGTPLLCGVDFSVERGDIASLLGPSGSGKTTLLRIIAGLEQPKRGRILLDGEALTGVPVHRRGIVLMFQEYALFPHKSVAENVAFSLQLKARRPSTEEVSTSRRVDEMLDLVGLRGFGERDVNELSGGERQRVALARSLAPSPRLLLLDEPLGALDRNLRERLMEELPAILHEVGVTALTVTHDQEEAFALADHVILLHDGRVVQAGCPEEVYRAPANAWTARFLGVTNLVEATVTVQQPPQVRVAFGSFALTQETSLPKPGTEGTLLIHPWGIYPTQGNIRLPGDPATIKATVTRRTFHGARYRLTVNVEGIELEFSLDLGQAIPKIGDEIHLRIMPAALRWIQQKI